MCVLSRNVASHESLCTTLNAGCLSLPDNKDSNKHVALIECSTSFCTVRLWKPEAKTHRLYFTGLLLNIPLHSVHFTSASLSIPKVDLLTEQTAEDILWKLRREVLGVNHRLPQNLENICTSAIISKSYLDPQQPLLPSSPQRVPLILSLTPAEPHAQHTDEYPAKWI